MSISWTHSGTGKIWCAVIFRWRKPYLFLLDLSRVHFISRTILCKLFFFFITWWILRYFSLFSRKQVVHLFLFLVLFWTVSLCLFLFSTYVSFHTEIKNFSFGKTIFLIQVFSPALEWRKKSVLAAFKKDKSKILFFLPFHSFDDFI